MVQTTDMANDRTNQFKIMLSDDERAWLEAIAARRGLTSSDVLRQYIRDTHQQLEEKKLTLSESAEDDFRWKQWHTDILDVVTNEKDPIATDDVAREMCGGTHHYQASWSGLGLALNQLVRNGYLRRLKTGYVVTPKGRAALER
jgi:hypothetical protein